MAERLGIIPYRYAQPVFHGLREKKPGQKEHFDIVEDYPATLAVKLREKELDGAFLSPIDYAREYAMYRILPGVAVVAEGESRSALALFNEHLHSIKSLAVDARSSSEIVLAHLVMAEKYDTVPKIIPFIGSVEQALDKADAVLCVGDEALHMMDHTNKLDLVDEWEDITGMPFVHGMWVAREKAFSPSETNNLIESARRGVERVDEYVQSAPAGYFEQFGYEFNQAAITSLTEFFRMAYYHGILQDIPDVKFHSLDGMSDSPAVSVN